MDQQDTLVDVVKARLAAMRESRLRERNYGEEAQMPAPRYTLDVADLSAIAERHFGQGRDEGFRVGNQSGLQRGREEGMRVQHDLDSDVLNAVLTTISERVCRIAPRIQAPPAHSGRERRTKEELVAEATRLLDEITAELGLLSARAGKGEFDVAPTGLV